MKHIRQREGPEHKIQRELVAYLEVREWLVEVMHGNAFQRGIPDLYLFHRKWGQRWVDVKNPKQYAFTKAQKFKWPRWEKAGLGIWILTAASQEEYDKLFAAPNWRDYWKPSWAPPTPDEIDKLLQEVIDETAEETEPLVVLSDRLGDVARDAGRGTD